MRIHVHVSTLRRLWRETIHKTEDTAKQQQWPDHLGTPGVETKLVETLVTPKSTKSLTTICHGRNMTTRQTRINRNISSSRQTPVNSYINRFTPV